MTLAVDPGHQLNGTDLVQRPVQSVGLFLPTPSQRVGRVVVNRQTGAARIVKGIDGSVQPPAIRPARFRWPASTCSAPRPRSPTTP